MRSSRRATVLLALALAVAPAMAVGPSQASPCVAGASCYNINGQTRALDGTNVFRAANTLVRYDRSNGQTSSPANEWGFEVAVVGGKVTAISDRKVGMVLPADGYVLSGHGTEEAWLKANAPIGATVTPPGGTAPPPATQPPPPSSSGVPTTEVYVNNVRSPIAGTNTYRAADTLVVYTRTGSQTVSPANQWGTEAAVLNGKVTEVRDRVSGGAAMAIPEGGYVLSGHGTAASYLNANAKVGASVSATASGGTTQPPPPPPPAEPPPPTTSATWTGQYFDNQTLTGTPATTRQDTAIDFNWPGNTPAAPGLSGYEDSARWTRTSSYEAGDYTFSVTGDDGIRVKLDGTTIIDGWKDQGPTTYTAVRSLTAGNHTVVVEHYEAYGDATARLSITKGAVAPPPQTGLAATGRWSQTLANGIRAMHGTVLRDGRVLMIAGSGNDWEGQYLPGTFRSIIFNPANNSFTEVPTPVDMFCSGHVTLPDGRVLVQGGTGGYAGTPESATWKGLKTSYIFNPATNSYTRTNDAMEGHWYPTLTKLENGNIWAAGGYDETGAGATDTEMFDSAAGRWLTKPEVPQTNRYLGTYPHMFLLADGRMFYTGAHTFGSAQPGTGSFLYNWRNATIGDIAGLRDVQLRDQAGSVILPPAQNQRFMIAGGGSTDNGGATASVDLINMNEANPQWRPGPAVPGGAGRMYLNLTTLFDRTVLASNGSQGPRGAGGNVQSAAIFNPANNTWSDAAADPVPRNYHSVSMLLPDGRVMVFSSNPANNSWESRISIYEPPYLFKGTRPEVTAPASATYGQSIQLGVTGNVVSASLTAPMSQTHQMDTNQRLVDLPISGTGAARTATVPANPALLPPGPYMLTVLDDKGAVSTAKWVSVR